METIFLLLFMTAFSVSLGLYNGFLVADDKTDEADPRNSYLEKMWHLLGATVFCMLAFMAQTLHCYIEYGSYYLDKGWPIALFTLSCFWLLFAGLVHRIGLNKPFFYVGEKAVTDRLIRKIASWVNRGEEETSALMKISFFGLTLVWVLL